MRTWIASWPRRSASMALAHLTVLLATVTVAQAQPPVFVQTSGPGGGPAGNLACAPDGDLFVIANGIHRSANDGASWAKLPFAPTNVSGLAVDPNGSIYAFRYYDMFRSIDDGHTWSQLFAAPSAMARLYFDADGCAFAGTYSGLYRATDGGSAWTLVGMAGSSIGAITQTADGTLYAGARDGLYRSIDDGLTWQLFATLPDGITAIAERPQGGLYLGVGGGSYSGAPAGGFFHIDASGSYDLLGLERQYIASILVQSDGTVFIAGGGICGDFVCWGPGIFRSVDGGATWTSVGSWLSPVQSLVGRPGGAMFASTGHLASDIGSYPATGVLRSIGAGDLWTPVNNGLVHATVYSMAVGADNTVWVAADQTVFSTEDQGATWTPVATAPPAQWSETSISYRLAVHPSGDVLAVSYPLLSRSRDRGMSWTPLDPTIVPVDLAVTAAGTLVGVAWGHAVRSVDRGDSWTFIDTGWSLPWSLFDAAEIAVGPLGSIAVASQTETHLSEDDGLTWTTIAPFRGPLAFAPDENALYVADGSGVQQLIRQGDVWVATPLPSGPNRVGDLVVDADGWVYAYDETGVSRTRPGETSWAALGGLVPEFAFLLGWRPSLLVTPEGHLYAGTASAGVFRSSALLETPSDASLAFGAGAWRVFPNPFRGRTTFAFALPAAERVTLSMYDVRGRLVQTLARSLPAGPQSLTWSVPPNTPSGTYFYRLQTKHATRAGRLLKLE